MCQYLGGKIRLGSEISNMIKKMEIELIGCNNAIYFEPFLGMAGVFRHMSKDSFRTCIGCDAHEDLMLMWKAINQGWKPPQSITKNLHQSLKSSPPSALRAFVGFGSSYMGRFFSGYSDTCMKSYKQVVSISDIFTSDHVHFLDASDYKNHDPQAMTIYCDPPYQESTRSNNLVSGFEDFENNEFWEVMRKWSENNLVFVSETSAPDDWICEEEEDGGGRCSSRHQGAQKD